MVKYFELDDTPASRVDVPHMMLTERRPARPTTLVSFEGRGRVAYHGNERHSSWTGEAVFSGHERDQAESLMALFDQAFDDARLLRMVITTSITGAQTDVRCWVDYVENRAAGSVTRLALTIEEADVDDTAVYYGGGY